MHWSITGCVTGIISKFIDASKIKHFEKAIKSIVNWAHVHLKSGKNLSL